MSASKPGHMGSQTLGVMSQRDERSVSSLFYVSFSSLCAPVRFQAQVAFLQGERKGQENMKQDLVRRIKMLEYALKQER